MTWTGAWRRRWWAATGGGVAAACAHAMADVPPDGGLSALVSALKEASPAAVAELEGEGGDDAGDAVVTVWGVETEGSGSDRDGGGAPAAVWAPAVDGDAPVERFTVQDGQGGRVAGVRRRLKVGGREGGREGRPTGAHANKTINHPFTHTHTHTASRLPPTPAPRRPPGRRGRPPPRGGGVHAAGWW